jgi:hypothetical protein
MNQQLTHDEARLLLPWLAVDRLAEAELAALCEHLKTCRACRRELPYLNEIDRLVALGGDDEAARLAHDSAVTRRIDERWQRVDARLGPALERLGPEEAPRPAAFSRPAATFWRRAALAQAAALVLVALAFALRPSPLALAPESALPGQGDQAASFVTLSDAEEPPAAGERPRWRFVPAPELGADALRELLLAEGLEIVGGPSARGVYTLAPAAWPPASPSAALDLDERWRGDLRVLLIEPVLEAGKP